MSFESALRRLEAGSEVAVRIVQVVGSSCAPPSGVSADERFNMAHCKGEVSWKLERG